ncbi:MAG: TnpV protein [Clostridiales bacterium]|nr:TnpV protein [Clostridiales bacterium]
MEITYRTTPEGYQIPNLTVPVEPEYDMGRFGQMRKQHLKTHCKILYANLLTSGELYRHLCEIDQTAQEQFELITKQMAKAEGVTEQLKAENQMLWVGRMNSIRNRAEEIIRAELIYI